MVCSETCSRRSTRSGPVADEVLVVEQEVDHVVCGELLVGGGDLDWAGEFEEGGDDVGVDGEDAVERLAAALRVELGDDLGGGGEVW